jgi:hypothetical protein
MGCGTHSIWECLEDPPEGYGKPEPWGVISLEEKDQHCVDDEDAICHGCGDCEKKCYYCGQKSDDLRETMDIDYYGEDVTKQIVMACPSCSNQIEKKNNEFA